MSGVVRRGGVVLSTALPGFARLGRASAPVPTHPVPTHR